MGGFCAVTLFHLFTPFPYEDYQVPVMPVLALVLAVQVPDVVVSPRERCRAARLIAISGLLFALSSAQWQDWFSTGRDRIWWGVRQEAPLMQLRRAARALQAVDPDAREVLTWDPYLALEAGLTVPPDMHMGPFSFFPDMDTATAERLHVMNTEKLLQLLEHNPPPVAALSGYAFTIDSPSIQPTDPAVRETIESRLQETYTRAASLPTFGQGGTELRLYSRSSDPDQGAGSDIR
jgi:hypothetical protein